MKKIYLLLLSLLTSILLSLAWPANGFSFLMLIAFVPLLFVEDYLYKNKSHSSRFSVLLYAYLSFILWNIVTTWWIYYASLPGAVAAIVLNSLFMALVWFFFHVTRRNIYKNHLIKSNYGYLALIAYWIAYEYFHLNWDLSWSWLNLGNGFSNYYQFVQWYEYTGTMGGSIWILLSNILVFICIKDIIEKPVKSRKVRIINLATTLIVIIIPMIISIVIYKNYKEKNNPVEVVAVQPNIDPYNEKFGGMTTEQQIDKMLNLAKTKINSNTQFIVAPETALPEGAWMDALNDVPSIKKIRALLTENPQISVVIGASTYKLYDEKEGSVTARQYPGLKATYDAYNSALYLDTSLNIGVYNKSKLVPGVEKMPYPKVFGFLEKFAIDLGGMSGTLGTQDERSVFKNAKNIKVAPVICYESIYGEFLTGYVKNGAQLIFIITNDGWWNDTPGYRQHCTYASLRAIETRRSIARSANTGISCFVNQRGDRSQMTKWWVADVILQSINANDDMTFYVKHGDFLGTFSNYLSLLMTLFTIVSIVVNRRNAINK